MIIMSGFSARARIDKVNQITKWDYILTHILQTLLPLVATPTGSFHANFDSVVMSQLIVKTAVMDFR